MATKKGFRGEEDENQDEFDNEDDDYEDADLDMEDDDLVADEDEFEEEEEEAPRRVVKRRLSKPAVTMIGGIAKTKLTDPALCEEAWAKLRDQSEGAEIVPYSMSEYFNKDEAIEHKKFGLGFVTEVIPPNKIEVIFQDALRKLVYGRS